MGSAPESALQEIVLFPLPGESRRRAERSRSRKGWYLFAAVVVVFCAAAIVFEIRTSALQSWIFGRWDSSIGYAVGPGPSQAIALPIAGPLDVRRGYTRLADFSRRLEEHGFRITEQARQTDPLADLVRAGIPPPFREAPLAGVAIRDSEGTLLYGPVPENARVFKSFDEIPPLLVQTLLFIENRRIGDDAGSRENPAIDWLRSAKAFMLYVGRSVGFNLPLEGGSTLATQLEKFQHSPSGRTSSPREKLRQLLAASLAAYQTGPDMRAARQQIVLDYLNTAPLGAVSGVGEINGLLNGLPAWFAMKPEKVLAALKDPSPTPRKARAYRHVLALLYSMHAPTYYLVRARGALDSRIDGFTDLLRSAGIIDAELASLVRNTSLEFAPEAPPEDAPTLVERKAVNAVRTELGSLLDVPNFYDLDRLDAQVDSTIDPSLEQEVTTLLKRLASPDFISANGFREPHVLDRGDPSGVIYSFLLLEARPEGNLVRVHTDTMAAPFDVNDGMKMELGSTAKLRTVAHYLEIMTQLHEELSQLAPAELARRAAKARDPLSHWAAMALFAEPHLDLDSFLDKALGRRYSASPDEAFYTGGGIHHFRNFEREDDSGVLSVREALIRSTNLVFIRLMRDLVRFHAAHLPYDADAVLQDLHSPARKALLTQIAVQESQKYQTSFAWLLNTHNREAQDLRLRNRIEGDAFERMTPYWRRLGFPFERLVPSYATAIGSSADRPAALAELMGIIVNDGQRRPTINIQRIGFAQGTPYETVFAPSAKSDEQVMRAPVAQLLRQVLAGVVESGTARRLNNAFRDGDGSAIAVGGKTGSGDNRFETFARDGRLLSAHPVSRTAGFVFYLGDRWFGVITASVSGPQSANYSFTSSLPLAVLKLLAPTLSVAVDQQRAATVKSASASAREEPPRVALATREPQ
jgi:membrane peptidoglycan carboxypeptidase